MANLVLLLDASLPYVVMTLIELFTSIYLVLVQSLLTDDSISATVLVVYQQLIASTLLAVLTVFFDLGRRPSFSLHLLSWASFVGVLQIPISQLMLAASLRYITATLQSVGLNVAPAVVFVLAAVTGQERFRFCSLNGLAKISGIVASTAGAILLVIFSDPGFASAGNGEGRTVGYVMVGVSVLAVALGLLLTEKLTLKYPSDLTLSAIINVLGTLQLVIVAAVTERDPSSWRISWGSSLQLLAIFYGGTVPIGLVYVARVWCIHKKGPVFGAAFSPLLIVFSFLFQTFVFGGAADIWSIVSALLVIGGLYLLLWSKSKDCKARKSIEDSRHTLERFNEEPLLVNIR